MDAFDALTEHLNRLPLAGMMLVVAGGFFLGRLSFWGLSIGPGGGTVLFALLLGDLGLRIEPFFTAEAPVLTVGLFGFCLFIYSVGFEAGPRLLSSRGLASWPFLLVGALVNVLAVVVAVLLGRVLGLDASTLAGALAGALSSVPTFAAASEVAPEPTRLAAAFAVSYPLGLIGVVVAVQLATRSLPPVRRFGPLEDLETHPLRRLRPEHQSPEMMRTFEVLEPDAIERSLRALALPQKTGCVIARIHRQDQFLTPRGDTVLCRCDRLLALGRVDELAAFARLVGPEVHDLELLREPPRRRVHVGEPQAIGKTLADLDLARSGVVVARIESGETLIEPDADARLERGDVIELVGDPGQIDRVAETLGRVEPPTTSTDIAIYAGGIFLGVLLSSLRVPTGLGDLSVGLATGLLVAGLVLGRFRTIGPFSAHVPAEARQLVRDLGILLFVAEIGIYAGGRLADMGAGAVVGPALLVAPPILLVPLWLSFVVGRRALGLPVFDAFGSIVGGLTSAAALGVLKRAARSSAPAPSFVASYALSSVLVTLAGRVLFLWM